MSANIEADIERAHTQWIKHNFLIIIIAMQTLLIVALLVLAINARASRSAHNQTLGRIDANVLYTKCIAITEGKAFGATAAAFATPPAPNTDRLAAVEQLAALGKQLTDPDHLCKEFIR